ncbi:hypothetical protein LCGC14_1308900 [marine sediment metagenome]|uniref:Uncharacterized protein n=1 Tax=marine sediment metagenome TaxID=412755 RepID=A0A0F9L7W3_9ZZZZ
MATVSFNAGATTSDTAVSVLTVPTTAVWRHLHIVNGAVVGFFSVDGGASFRYLPANETRTLNNIQVIGSIQIKRVASGSNMADVSGDIW